ncbi:hypothetical protein ACQP04_15640 [Pseudonocardia halophobica]|uniref:hypothetical protein n=1 Tax=Pseudonocardia halophobica TaxID=29401 RepID=UPI003D8FD28D
MSRALTATLATARADLPFGTVHLRSESEGIVEVASFGLTGPLPADGAVAAAVAEAVAGGGG